MEIAGYTRLGAARHGSMGRVYPARRERDGRRVALKVPNEPAGSDAERLLLEGEHGHDAGPHPHLVELLEVLRPGEDPAPDVSCPVLVLEWVDGLTLADCVRRVAEQDREVAGAPLGRLPLGAVAHVARGVLDGLAHLHARRIVHRDVKPENILLGWDGKVKLADLGIASGPVDSRLTDRTERLGATRYIAPEQQLRDPAGPTADVFALGAVLFEALAGEASPFFEHLDPGDDKLLVAKLAGPRPLAPLRPDLRAAVGTFLAALLAPVAATRPDASAARLRLDTLCRALRLDPAIGAAQLAEVLGALRAHEAANAPPLPPRPTLGGAERTIAAPHRSRRRTMLAGVAVVVSAVVMAGVSAWRAAEARGRRVPATRAVVPRPGPMPTEVPTPAPPVVTAPPPAPMPMPTPAPRRPTGRLIVRTNPLGEIWIGRRHVGSNFYDGPIDEGVRDVRVTDGAEYYHRFRVVAGRTYEVDAVHHPEPEESTP